MNLQNNTLEGHDLALFPSFSPPNQGISAVCEKKSNIEHGRKDIERTKKFTLRDIYSRSNVNISILIYLLLIFALPVE